MNKRIFISHSSKNHELVELFVDNILRLGLGISYNEIFCTSIQGMGIKTGDDFVHAIKDRLNEVDVVLLILSNEYKRSEICLNEMGAAWILSKKTYIFILAPLTYSEVGFLHITDQISKINSSDDLDNFKDTVEDDLQLTKMPSAIWNKSKEDFLRAIKSIDQPAAVSHKNDIGHTLSKNELKVLRAISSSFGNSDTAFGIQMNTALKLPHVLILLEDLHAKGYVDLRGSYYTVSVKGDRILFQE